MKLPVALAAIVISVLAAVAIQEMRIQNLRNELIQLRSIRSSAPAEDPATPVEPAPATPPFDEAPAVTPAAPVLPSRGIPEDFADPSEEEVRALAQRPISEFHYELGLNNRERAYLDQLLLEREQASQAAAQRWLETPPAERAAIEDELAAGLSAANQRLADFFVNPSELEQFEQFESHGTAREFLERLRPLMDQNGLVLSLDEEKKLVNAIHESRQTTGSTDWNSVEGLRVAASGEALDRFDTEWKEQEKFLIKELGTFLDIPDATTVLQSLREYKQPLRSQIEELARMASGTGEEPPASDTDETPDEGSDEASE